MFKQIQVEKQEITEAFFWGKAMKSCFSNLLFLFVGYGIFSTDGNFMHQFVIKLYVRLFIGHLNFYLFLFSLYFCQLFQHLFIFISLLFSFIVIVIRQRYSRKSFSPLIVERSPYRKMNFLFCSNCNCKKESRENDFVSTVQ